MNCQWQPYMMYKDRDCMTIMWIIRHFCRFGLSNSQSSHSRAQRGCGSYCLSVNYVFATAAACICVTDRFSRPKCLRSCIHRYHHHHHHHQSTRGCQPFRILSDCMEPTFRIYTDSALTPKKCFLQSYYEHYLDVRFTADRQIGAEALYNESVQPQTVRQHDLNRLRIPRHLTTLFPSWHRRCYQINLGMGARRKSSRPRRSPPETVVGFTSRDETETRR